MRIQRTLTAFLAAAALALPSMAGAQAPANPEPSRSEPKGSPGYGDRKFVRAAARSNLIEAELGKLASERASSDAVKQFGQRMATDHGKAYAELKELAQQKGLAMPTDLDPGQRELQERLSGLSGAEFDRAYVEEMVKDHGKDVSEFRRHAKRVGDADLKAWASKMLPTIEDHFKQVQQIHAQMTGRAAR